MKFSSEIKLHKNKPVVTEKHQFKCRHESKIIALLLDFSDYQDSDAKTKSDSIFMEMVCD